MTSTTRDDWQTTAAFVLGRAPGPTSALLALRGVITQRRSWTSSQAARMMAMVSVAYADGIIACFDAKYAYEFWRPITAIHKGATRTAMTQPSSTRTGCTSWAGTPNHPDYPSAHSCITPAGGEGTGLSSWELDASHPTMHSRPGLDDRHFEDGAGELTREVGEARIWGGIHFRSAVEDGIRMAKQTAAQVLDDNFERTRR